MGKEGSQGSGSSGQHPRTCCRTAAAVLEYVEGGGGRGEGGRVYTEISLTLLRLYLFILSKCPARNGLEIDSRRRETCHDGLSVQAGKQRHRGKNLPLYPTAQGRAPVKRGVLK